MDDRWNFLARRLLSIHRRCLQRKNQANPAKALLERFRRGVRFDGIEHPFGAAAEGFRCVGGREFLRPFTQCMTVCEAAGGREPDTGGSW
jgi:hypothetical protein